MPGCRVCVIGGGPAGLAAALEGARLGLDVDLLERNRIGENIRCAEGFYDSLQIVGKPPAGVRFKVNESIIKVNREYRVDCRKIKLWMIDRMEWQRHIAGQAREAGARILENTRVKVDDLQELQESYDWLIDASGVPPITSVKYGFRDYYRRHGAVTVQYVMKGDFSRQGERLKFVFFPHYEGYFWVFPKSRDVANIGLGLFTLGGEKSRQGKMLWQKLDHFIVQEGIKGVILRRHGGIIPIRILKQLRYQNILLVGDAAGCASPLHGGGIDTSLITGRLAAQCIAGDCAGDFSGEVRRLLQPKWEVERRLCEIWRSLDRDALDEVAGLITRNYKQIGLKGIIRCFPLLLRDLHTCRRFCSGLTTGKW